MKYTIAIPTYNNQKTIENTLLSVIDQDFEGDYEILVVNNSSTDDTLKILRSVQKRYDFNIKTNVKTVNLFENHNICFQEAKGDYVLFCHSDDTLLPDALKKIDQNLSRIAYPEKIVIWGQSFYNDFKYMLPNGIHLNTIVAGNSVQEFFQYGGLTPSGTCYSRKSFLKSGGFLPMRDSITPSDQVSMIKYSLDGAEFLMTDRLIFERNFASTATITSKNILYNSYYGAIEELALAIGEEKMEVLFDNISNFTRTHLLYIKLLSKYSKNKSKYRLYFLKHVLRNLPTFLKNELYLLKKINKE